MSDVLHHRQFLGGPGEAQEINDPAITTRRERQGRLFSSASLPRAEAYEQTPEQFSRDSRTWWHGRYSEELPREGNSGEGFHAGTEQAARERLGANFGTKPGATPARLFPLRLTTPVEQNTPADPRGDRSHHTSLGPDGKDTGYFYKNNSEDTGHISVGTTDRSRNFSTHREMVQEAQSQGKKVHQNISWAAEHASEHTGEDVVSQRRAWADSLNENYGLPDYSGNLFNPDQFHRGYETANYQKASGFMGAAQRTRKQNVMEPKSWDRRIL